MARFHREENVMSRLDADESSGYAIARYVLKAGDRCWTPDGYKYGPSMTSGSSPATAVIVFERLAGSLTYRYTVDGDPYNGRKWGAA